MLDWLFGPPKSPVYERHLFVCADPTRVVWTTPVWQEVHEALDWIMHDTTGPTTVGVTLLDETRKGPVNSSGFHWGDMGWTQPLEIARTIDAVVLRFSAPDLPYCEKKNTWSNLYFEASAPMNPRWSQVLHLVASESVASDPRFSASIDGIKNATAPFVHATRTAPWIETDRRSQVPQDFLGGGFYTPESTRLERPNFDTIDGEWAVTWLT